MDFIGPLSTTKSSTRYILNLVYYFSRFIIPFATKDANIESVLWCLRLAFIIYRKPYTFYYNRGQHFLNNKLKEFLLLEGVNIIYSPLGLSKSTGIVEVSNQLVEDILRKSLQTSYFK